MENYIEEFSFFTMCPLSIAKWLYLKRNIINLTHTVKKNEHACNYGFTMDRGIHHGPSVVSSVSIIFCSFSFHGHGGMGYPWGVNLYPILVNFGVK